MFKENKHLRRDVLLIGLGVLLSTLVVMADCDVGIFPSTPKDGSCVSFNYFWGNTPMITPFLEDKRNCWGWTGTGYGNLYDVGGFNRKDACELMCDGTGECNLFEDCTLFRGNSRECSDCEDDHLTADELDCTHDSEYDLDGDPCPGEPHDCYKICKQDAVVGLFYPLKVDLVFVVDTTGSMKDEWRDLCDILEGVIEQITDAGVDIESTIYALDTCIYGNSPCVDEHITPVHGNGDGNYECESWGDGVRDRAINHPWRRNTKKVIFAIADEGPHGGCENPGDQRAIDQAIKAALDNSVVVYGLWGKAVCVPIFGTNPPKSNTDFMLEIASQTGGSAYSFDDADAATNAIISAVTNCPNPFKTIEVDLYSHKWSDEEEYIPPPPEPELRKYCFLKGAVKGVTTFIIPDTSIDDTQQPTAEPVATDKQHVWKIEHPAFTIIETGNMPFKVVNPEFEVDDEGHVYRIKRVYWPDHSDSQKEFSVHSELVFAYTLLESVGGYRADATPLDIEATHAYTSMTLTNTYYVACKHRWCDGGCSCWSIPNCDADCCYYCDDEK